jgi:hypothetical protein
MRARIPRRWVLLAGALLALPTATSAQQTYRITLKEPNKGDKLLYRKIARLRMEAGFAADKDKEIPTKNDEKTHDFEFLQEVVDRPADASKGVKLQREYRRAERTADGAKRTLVYAGKKVLIEKRDGLYRFRTHDGTALAGDEAKELDEEFNKKAPQLPSLSAAWLVPKAAVKVGECWTIDPKPFIEHLRALDGAQLETGPGTASGKLVRVYRKDGRQYGVLDLRVEIPVPSFGPDKVRIKLKNSKLTLRMLADGCIDGSSFAYRVKGVLEWSLNGTAEEGGMQLHIRARIQGDYFESRQEPGKE